MTHFATQLMAWQRVSGRHDLPWQQTRDPYAVWVSEIMLQQTQVNAVIGYYQRFMSQFPTLESLAAAPQEQVMQYWSGLGYYARARNLHRAAQLICERYAGAFPENMEDIQSLPGIGRSTAAAISAFCFGQRQAILDGNVKRVLSRYFGIEGWPGTPSIEHRLWGLAESLLPEQGIETYTQGLMDLGATLCTRGKPQCQACPFTQQCQAYLQQRTHELPTPKPKKVMPERSVTLLLCRYSDQILLQKRPATGIWGGLWSLPELSDDAILMDSVKQRFAVVDDADIELEDTWPIFVHTFSHYKLAITPQVIRFCRVPTSHSANMLWMPLNEAIGAAIPAPVRTLLKQLKTV